MAAAAEGRPRAQGPRGNLITIVGRREPPRNERVYLPEKAREVRHHPCMPLHAIVSSCHTRSLSASVMPQARGSKRTLDAWVPGGAQTQTR